jgi:trimeric autotransporter adhesin
MKSYFFRNPSLSRAAIAALGLALIVGLGTPPAAAQFVCDRTTPGGADGATATGGFNVACGTNAWADGAFSRNSAFGIANAHGDASINTATGFNANANGDSSFNTATGNSAIAFGNGSHNTATGTNANANGNSSFNTATGTSANASGTLSSNVATGNTANASGAGSFNTAYGASADAHGGTSLNPSSNIAIGNGAQAIGDGTSNTAVGSGSRANFANSAAFGHVATVTRADQQVFGTGTRAVSV